MTNVQILTQPDSIHTVEDALAQVGQLSSSEMSQQVQFEALPPLLVFRFNRFLYDAAADGTVKIIKPIRFAPELEIPPGTIFLYSLVLAKAKISSFLCPPRNHGPRCR